LVPSPQTVASLDPGCIARFGFLKIGKILERSGATWKHSVIE
jgi:hypothetical protein